MHELWLSHNRSARARMHFSWEAVWVPTLLLLVHQSSSHPSSPFPPTLPNLYLPNVEDQLEINEFGKLNGKKKEMQQELQEIEKRILGLEEAEEGIMLADESKVGCIKMQVGDCFIDSDAGAAGEVVTAALVTEKQSKAGMEESLAALVSRQENLKRKLYARFGTSISLDDPTQAS